MFTARRNLDALGNAAANKQPNPLPSQKKPKTHRLDQTVRLTALESTLLPPERIHGDFTSLFEGNLM